MKQYILLLEDDPNLGFVLQEHLESKGFAVTLRSNGEEGLTISRRRSFQLCLVDVMMPRKDGFTFAREFRMRDSRTPIIFLTAKSMKEDRIEGFKAGADDYVTKPFSMEELFLRIQAVLRRNILPAAPAATETVFALGKYSFDSAKQVLQSGKKEVSLTEKESQLLAMLSTGKNTLVLRHDILQAIWGNDSYFNGRSLDVYISKIRKLLSSDKRLEIRSVHGKGYKLIEAKEESNIIPPKN